jgi:hypothetical protein
MTMAKVNETGLWRMIDERIRYMDMTPEQVDVQPLLVDVMFDRFRMELGQNTAVLVNIDMDVPATAQLIIDSGNNMLVTSRRDYEKLTYAGYRFFEDAIEVSLNNYGEKFTPFRLEFLQIIPKLK